MNRNELLKELAKINRMAETLFCESLFYPGMPCKGALPFDRDSVSCWYGLERLGELLYEFHASYPLLTLPVCGQYRLKRQKNGRYGYTDSHKIHQEYTCGQTLEILLPDRSGTPHWCLCRIEHNQKDYYATDYPEQNLAGCLVRERGKRL